MLKYYVKASEALKQLRADQNGVVSFEYIIVAAAVVTIVIAFFAVGGAGGTGIAGALNAAIAKLVTAIGT